MKSELVGSLDASEDGVEFQSTRTIQTRSNADESDVMSRELSRSVGVYVTQDVCQVSDRSFCGDQDADKMDTTSFTGWVVDGRGSDVGEVNPDIVVFSDEVRGDVWEDCLSSVVGTLFMVHLGVQVTTFGHEGCDLVSSRGMWRFWIFLLLLRCDFWKCHRSDDLKTFLVRWGRRVKER